jgi:AcrR family transcriptional regulator
MSSSIWQVARMSPAERRQAIIDAALKVALRNGLASTTVRDVAAEMGTSSGLIHHYFESMDAVLATAFEQAAGHDLAITVAAVGAADHPLEKLRAFFRTYASTDQDWAFQLWLDAWAEASRRPALQRTSQRLNVAWQQLLAATIKSGLDDGSFETADPEASAWRVISLLDGLSLQVVAHRTTLDRATVFSWVTRATELELGLPRGALASSVPA